MRVMTYNVRVGVESSLAALAAAVRAAGVPDLLALQEIGVDWNMGERVDQPATLAAALGLPHHAFAGALTDAEGGQFGVAIVSRWPLAASFERLPRQDDEQRVLQRALVDTPQGALQVFNTHLSVNAPERLEQARFVGARIAAASGPVVLLGDLNDRPGTPVVEACRGPLVDAFDAAGAGPPETFSVVDPHRRIDYAACGGGLAPTAAEVVRAARASDHFPLVATLAWT